MKTDGDCIMTDQGNKLKLLYLKELFEERTDGEHEITIKDMQAYLDGYGISADRRTLYQDIETLQFYGMDIDHERNGRGYRLLSREFEPYEVKLMIDAVSSSRFLSERRSRELVEKLKRQCSHFERDPMQRQLMLANRVKGTSKVLHINVNEVFSAIGQNRNIRFRYFKYDLQKNKGYHKRIYEVSPWDMLYADDQYYLLAYDPEEKKEDKRFKYFRVDRMDSVKTLESRRQGQEEHDKIDMVTRTKNTFNMFGGKVEYVTLRFPNFQFEIAMDRFGHDIIPAKDGPDHFTVTVPVAVGPHFYGWIFGLKNYVTIVGPEYVRKGMIEMLEAVGKRYE